jgi:hypothetical protein
MQPMDTVKLFTLREFQRERRWRKAKKAHLTKWYIKPYKKTNLPNVGRWGRYGHPNPWNSKNPNYTQLKEILQCICKLKILRVAREKCQTIYKGISTWLTANFSAENLQAKRKWDNIFRVLKEKNLSASKVTFQKWRRNKSFLNKLNLKEFIITRPDLEEILL